MEPQDPTRWESSTEILEKWGRRCEQQEFLIAELLEALKGTLEAFDTGFECDCGGSDMCAVCNALKAIAKAEGRE